MSEISPYAVLASAIAGHRIAVHVSASAQDRYTFTDGQTLWLPAERTACGGTIWRDIVAQASLIAAGSLSPPLLRHLLGRRRMTLERYLVLEVLRASRLYASRLPLRYCALPEIRDISPVPLSTFSAEASLELALGDQPVPSRPDFFGVIRPYAALRRVLGEQGLAALTRRQPGGNFKLASKPSDELPEDEEAEESKILKLFANPLSFSSFLADMLNKVLGGGAQKGKRERSSGGDGPAEMAVGRIEMGSRRGAKAVAARLDFELPALDASAESSAHSYPEWDVHAGKYRQNWVFADAVEPWRADGPRDVSSLTGAFRSLELRRQLASLGLSHEMHGREQDGIDFDLGPLLNAAIDLRTGHSPSSLRVYRASRRTRRDLGVVIALDVSGSTGEGISAAGTQFEKQLQAAYQLGQAFDALGDSVELFGFHSWGRTLMRWLPLKNHDERWSGAVAQRFAQLDPVGFSRIGAAVRHADRLLRSSVRLPHRLIILVTDGFPYDHEYESRYAEADLRKALDEAAGNGTACICLCVGTRVDAQKLNRIFGGVHLITVDEPEQITGRIRGACRNAFGAVFRHRASRC